jgi:hypothetical protein
MKINLNSLSKFSNPEKYKKVIDIIDKNRKTLEENKEKYSEREDYDKILKLHEQNRVLVENFRVFLNNKELLMEDVVEAIKKHQEAFIKNSNIKELSKTLGIESIIGEENISNIRNINEIYAKVQENSNILIIYDIDKKRFHQIKDENHFFNAKSNCYYIKDMKLIFVCGGIKNFNRIKEYSNEFYKIKVKINFDEFDFEYTDLPNMNHGRASHSMIQCQDYLITIGGINTKTCEIFDLKKNQWEELPDLPSTLVNPAVALVNNFLYVFSGSGSLNSLDRIYKLSMNNITRIIQKERGFENILDWEKIDYIYRMLHNEKIPRMRRGMAALSLGDTVYLFGGFDYDNIYDDIYVFHTNKEIEVKTEKADANVKGGEKNLEKEKMDSNMRNVKNTTQDKNLSNNKIDINFDSDEEIANNFQDFNPIPFEEDYFKITDTEIQLPIKTFFNSNLLLFDNYLIMIDGYNNAIELNLKTQEFYYYT